MSKHYSKKQRRRDDRIILFIYGLIIAAFLSIIFSAWWVVFRTTRYYSVPYPAAIPDVWVSANKARCTVRST